MKLVIGSDDMTSLKEVKDECSRCENFFTCELCRKGHGIKTTRSNVTDMLRCQYDHKKRRNKGYKNER